MSDKRQEQQDDTVFILTLGVLLGAQIALTYCYHQQVKQLKQLLPPRWNSSQAVKVDPFQRFKASFQWSMERMAKALKPTKEGEKRDGAEDKNQDGTGDKSQVHPLIGLTEAIGKHNLAGQRAKDETLQRLKSVLQKHGRPVDELLQLTRDEEKMARDIIDPADIDSGFADIGGLDDLNQEIWQLAILPMRKPKIFGTSSKLIQRPSGILLYGKPGCGKTLLAKAIAKECRAIFIPIELSTLLTRCWGESEKLVAATFSLARKVAPSIVFFDEMDCVFGSFDSTSNNNSLYLDCIKKCFLTELDGISTKANGPSVLVFGATNRPQSMDKAILRRFPRTFSVPLPNGEGREKILRVLLKGESMDDAAKAFLPKLAHELTDGYSGSDLKALCAAAVMEPVLEASAEEAKLAVQCGDWNLDKATSQEVAVGQSHGGKGEMRNKSNNGLATKACEEPATNASWADTSVSIGDDSNASEEPAILQNDDEQKLPPKLRPVSEKDFRAALNKVKQTGKVAGDYGESEMAPSAEMRNSLYV